jgi:hypothetical protein
MIVVIDRKWKKDTYTIGRVFIDDVFFANSMEDKDRGLTKDMPLAEIKKRKVYGETAIPAGKYEVRMTYSPKYKRMMPQVMDVPGWTGVRMHSMNEAKDSLGCIGLGKNDKPGWISNSRATCAEFEKRLIAAGGTCELEIV